MKKLTILGLAALTSFTASCLDLDEAIITGVTHDYYDTQVGFEALVNATYEPMRTFYAQERGFTLTAFGTDEYTKGADGGHKFYNDYTPQLNPGASFLRDTWRDFFRAINTTNAAVGRAPTVTMDSALKAQRVAEARFLQAFYYFHLVQMFGDVPLQLEETLEPITTATRTPKADIYAEIIKDLEYASTHLPTVQQKDYGRVTKGAAQHFLAKVYLTRADPGDVAKAIAYADSVINSGVYGLLPRWADVFDIKNERNKEIIFTVQFTADPLTTGPGNRGHLYFLMEYDVQAGMKRDIQNGRPFKRFRPTTWLLGLWNRTADSRYHDSFTNVWYANNEASIPKNADGTLKYRLGDTAVWLPDVALTAAQKAAKPYRVYNPNEYSSRVFPSLKKFHDSDRLSVNDERGDRDFFVARLAETYLLVAEAHVRNGNAALALPYVNAVRTRAAKPGQTAAMQATAAQMTLDFILDERSRELAGESMRWFDLVRTGKLVDRVKLYNPDGKNLIQAFHALRPIPTDQIDRTSNVFAQNPGY